MNELHRLMGRLESVAASVEGQVTRVHERLDDLGRAFSEHTHLAAAVEPVESAATTAEETIEAPAEAAAQEMPEPQAPAIPETAPMKRNRFRLRNR